ncbi:glycosyltransferase family 2 protein [Brucella intermedia]|uniref:glycosyltransferase family 2 protein n=1 Tax=Brucella intermedia TaxID=94625 RepID=UPI00124C489F|nr:glycosyltransferase family 2 protein [Brucella intermedia]KAB2671130.1 glycosyltransferase family 2 protein [Ochrobactrum sp. LMG 5442]KAB2716552.1 glycosyltransferase family 2 protein [Brucella intermedia]
MKITGIILQRNEIDIILFNALHHLRFVGLDELIIGDNGSSDGSVDALRRLNEYDHRLRVVDMSGDYQQASRVNEMYQMAIDNGADWVIPLDADEFLPINRKALESVLSNTADAAVRMQVHNFVQCRRVETRRMRNIASIYHVAAPTGSFKEAYDLVNSGRIGFVESTYPPKFIWRSNRNLVIGKGNHGAANIDLTDVSEIIPLNHVPLRSKAAITERIQRIKRLETKDQITSWHIKRLATVDVDDEWCRNSAKGGSLDINGDKHRLSFDPFFWIVFLRYAFTVRKLVR